MEEPPSSPGARLCGSAPLSFFSPLCKRLMAPEEGCKFSISAPHRPPTQSPLLDVLPFSPESHFHHPNLLSFHGALPDPFSINSTHTAVSKELVGRGIKNNQPFSLVRFRKEQSVNSLVQSILEHPWTERPCRIVVRLRCYNNEELP